VEKNLQQYTVGASYYFFGNNQKMAVDYSLLARGLEAADPGNSSVQNQQDHRFRIMFQQFF